MNAVGAERLDRQRGRQRRVDAARDGDDDVAEAVLLDVVAQPELEREPHLLELAERLRDWGLQGAPVGRGPWLSDVDDLDRRQLAALARERAPPHVGQAPPDHLGGIDVDHKQGLLEGGRSRDDHALVVEDDGVAVEDQLVLAADRIAEREIRRIVARAGDEHLLALAVLADVERGCRDVADQLRAGEREVGRRRPRLPDVLADRRSDQRPPVLEQEEVATRREVAILVEDAVVGEEALAVDRLHLAVGADRARVEEIAVEMRRADENDDAASGCSDLAERRLRGADEARPQQQVLRGVAGDGELGEEDEVCAAAARLAEPLEDPGAVALEIADDRVELRERESHQSFCLTVENILSRAVEVMIPARFNGPPATANGGYTCGLVARLLGVDAEVTLRRPPPLDRPLRWDGAALC